VEGPKVSIIIPTFNRQHMLKDAISSVLAQTYKNFEIIIVDDGSTDDTKDVVKAFGDYRIKYIWQENAGVSSARNHGVRLSQGEYIAFLDSDDIYLPWCIEEKLKVVELQSGCIMVGGGCNCFNKENPEKAIQVTHARKSVGYEDFCIFTAFPGGTSNIFALRRVVIESGGFNTFLRASEDRDFLRRLSKFGEIGFVDKECVSIRIHDEVRPHRNIKQVLANREWISSQIPELRLRIRSRAWNYIVIGNQCWSQNHYIKALYWWLRSFAVYPLPVHHELPRLRPILRDYVLKRWQE